MIRSDDDPLTLRRDHLHHSLQEIAHSRKYLISTVS